MADGISVEIDLTKLRQLRAQGGPRATRKALGKTAFFCEASAKDLMTGSGSGEIYGTHQASAPGEPPAVLTGNLKNSIRAAAVGDGSSSWEVRVGAEYGAPLEFGTARMEPRPFMRPAVEETKKIVGDVFKEAFAEL
jgi:HK97 gp10 family phage protein